MSNEEAADEESNVVDFASVKSVKEFVENANNRIMELENCLYDILDTDRLDIAKEMAAEVLEEDLDVYLEEEFPQELDFDHDADWVDVSDEGEDLPWEN